MTTDPAAEALRVRLATIDADIAAHPLAAEPVRQAHELIERSSGREHIADELAARGLPSAEELGKIQLAHTASWWRLHRSRNSVVKKLER